MAPILGDWKTGIYPPIIDAKLLQYIMTTYISVASLVVLAQRARIILRNGMDNFAFFAGQALFSFFLSMKCPLNKTKIL